MRVNWCIALVTAGGALSWARQACDDRLKASFHSLSMRRLEHSPQAANTPDAHRTRILSPRHDGKQSKRPFIRDGIL